MLPWKRAVGDLLQHPSEMGIFSTHFTEFLGLFSVLFSGFY